MGQPFKDLDEGIIEVTNNIEESGTWPRGEVLRHAAVRVDGTWIYVCGTNLFDSRDCVVQPGKAEALLTTRVLNLLRASYLGQDR